MRNELNNVLLGFAWGIMACVLITWVWGGYSFHEAVDTEKDTIYRSDTVREPVAVRDTLMRWVRVPVSGTAQADTVIRILTDTVAKEYTAEVPVTQREYKDSLYTAWVSGYMAKLDSISLVSREILVTKKVNNSPWSIGLQGGYGYMNGKMSPYIGVGIIYSLVRF